MVSGWVRAIASWVAGTIGYRRRWQILGLARRRFVSAMPIVVIGGCGSSGTTLLRRMLDRHKAISCGPESSVFLKRVSSPAEIAERFCFDPARLARMQRESRSQAEFIEAFGRLCLARSGKRVWADKTPENVRRFAFVKRHFPNAKLIHVVRDGRDAACSLRTRSWMKPRGRTALDRLGYCARYWAGRVRAGRRFRGRPDYLELRYEDLVRAPETVLRQVTDFLGLDWDDAMTKADAAAGRREERPVYGNAIGRWRKEFSSPDLDRVMRAAGPVLADLGYIGAVPKRGLRILAERLAPLGQLGAAIAAIGYWYLPENLMPGRIDDVAFSILCGAVMLYITPADMLRRLAPFRVGRVPARPAE